MYLKKLQSKILKIKQWLQLILVHVSMIAPKLETCTVFGGQQSKYQDPQS
jgi:hypothetical protein